MIEIQRLSDENSEQMRSMLSTLYLEGMCYPFALAVHMGSGWRMVGFMAEGEIHHVGVRCPEGRYFDARGFVEEDSIRKPFTRVGDLPEVDVSVEDLMRHPKSSDHNVERALELVQVAYPFDIPWVEGTPLKKIEAFATALEQLCREHRVWIRAALPTCLPVVYHWDGDETIEDGFVISFTMNGGGYFIDRKIAE